MWVAVFGKHPFSLAFICTLISSALCFFILSPDIGFDDANITMNYAENIAAGHGYVYNIGGERVEGSTSPLWTAVTALAYFVGLPVEHALACVGFLVAVATIWVSMRLGDILFTSAGLAPGLAYPIVFVAFLSIPSYFGWTVWSLMDFGFWVLLMTIAIWLTLRLITGDVRWTVRAGMMLTVVLMVATRPEGIAMVAIFAVPLILSVVLLNDRSLIRVTAQTLIAALATFVLIAVARHAYFGDIFPNTYYAKVSTDRTATLLQGLGYAKAFLKSPLILGFLALVVGAPLVVWRLRRAYRMMFLQLWIALILVVGAGMVLYIAVGGDHFGSFRFFLFVFPMLFPVAAVTLSLGWKALATNRLMTAGPAIAASALIAATWSSFATDKGHYVHELRIAEDGRKMGRILANYPGQPSIGVVAAGGVAMTYDGHIYDLMGLNWVEMARADRSKVGNYINHRGFSRDVFYRIQPDIMHPSLSDCDRLSYDTNPFFPKVFDYVFSEPEFLELYTFECWEGLAFYLRKDFQGNAEQSLARAHP